MCNKEAGRCRFIPNQNLGEALAKFLGEVLVFGIEAVIGQSSRCQRLLHFLLHQSSSSNNVGHRQSIVAVTVYDDSMLVVVVPILVEVVLLLKLY